MTSTAHASLMTQPSEESAGVGGAVRWIPRGSRVFMVVDEAVAGGGIVSGLLADLHRSGVEVDVARSIRPPTTADVRRLAHRMIDAPGAWVVGIGGGAAMDSAALAALWASDPAAADWCVGSQRSGLVSLPGGMSRTYPLMLVPTTIGTGAENSHSACFVHADGRRLVVHPSLRADVAVHDADLLAMTPSVLVHEGRLEVLYRLSVLLIGADGQRSRDDADIVTAVRELVRLAESPETTANRGALAQASARSQSAPLMTGANPFSGKLWYVAAETSEVLGSRKVAAIAALLPSMFALIRDGRTGWGEPDRLARFWETVCSASAMSLSESPERGIHELIAQWGVQPVELPPEDIETIVQRTVRRWCGGLPMLRGLRSNDVRELVVGAAARGTGGQWGPPVGDLASRADHPAGSAEK